MNKIEVIGQDIVLNYLKEIVKNKKVGSSFLFSGSKGIGKTTCALWLAQILNCKDKNPPCGKCLSCIKIYNKNHPDLTIIEPISNFIKIDQIRDFQKEIYYKPYLNNYKIYIIKDAHKLIEEAQNCMLKTLEEPPDASIIILIAEIESSLLPTVISRCQKINFAKIIPQDIKDYLINKYQAADSNLDLLINLSKGSLGKTQKFLQNPNLLKMRAKILDLILNIPNLNLFNIIELSNKLEEYKDNLEYMLEILLSWFRDLILLKYNLTDYIINKDKILELKEQMNFYSLWQINKAINLILEFKINFYRNINLRLLLQNILIKLMEL
ncbi:MAG: DNA polymerase III subunit delta' [Armatimonadetes bacterium]|nr:DNA polymerase III subunit delta' [Armatimonadota bacterium]